AEVLYVRAGLDDLCDLRDGVPELVVGVVVMRPEPDSGFGTEVAENLPFGELAVDGFELGCADSDSAAAAGRIAGAPDFEAGGLEEIDQQVRLAERVRADPADADLLDQVVSSRCGVERGDVRRPREEPRGARRIFQLGL